jgi:hypothetical protein
MSRTQESGAYLGGIGTMLGVADVCPSCGQTHSDEQFGITHRGPRECPKVVMGSFPVMSQIDLPEFDLEQAVRPSAARKIREFETPAHVSLGSLPIMPRIENEPRHRSLAAPWLRPPDLGDIL